MKTVTLSVRTAKEILRDPINLFFGIGFPVVLILLLTAIQRNIPTGVYELEALIPGITVFGLAFMTLFSATLLSKDRESALLQRQYTTPLSASNFILGYALPMIPISVLQSIVCYTMGAFLGLNIGAGTIVAVLLIIPL